MNEQMRVQRPAPQGGMSRPEGMPYRQESSKLPWIIGIIVVLIAILAGAYFMLGNGGGAMGSNHSINKDKFQAVFLSNNQVYFGKISSISSDEIVLENIHYLQLNNVQGAGAAGAQPTDNGSTQIVLVKLGNELHGPEDRMHISKNQVIFYEDLKDDGRVVQSIKASNASGGANSNIAPAGGASAAPAAR